LLQCVITLPDEPPPLAPPSCAQHVLGFDDLSVRLNAPSGATVVFDSFSHERERMEWSTLVETVNGAGGISRHADWNVRVSGSLSAVLGPENIAAYRALEPKADPEYRPPEPTTDDVCLMVTEFDEEIQALKRHCAGLTDSDIDAKPHFHRQYVAETLLSMTPGSFADVLRSGHPTPLSTPPDDEVSAAVSALCEFGRRLER
jgi:hypothetical protein